MTKATRPKKPICAAALACTKERSCAQCSGCTDHCACYTCTTCQVRRHADSRCGTCSQCENCCECWFCSGCDRTHVNGVSQCERCERCFDSCNCPYCEACEENVSSVCPSCGYCRTHCECVLTAPPGAPFVIEQPVPLPTQRTGGPTVPTVEQRIETADFMRTNGSSVMRLSREEPVFWNAKSYKENPSRRFVAVEIEIAESNPAMAPGIDAVVAAWRCSVVRDPSLPETGYEINTSPANGDLFTRQIRDFAAALKTARASLTTRCGMHTHADCRDFSYYDMRRVLILYSKCERGIYSLVPPWRREAHFCVPCGDLYGQMVIGAAHPKIFKRKMISTIYTNPDRMRKEKTEKRQGTRYRALNLHSWVYRGTLELRTPEGATEYEDIAGWGMLWAAFIDYAYKTSERDITALSATDGGFPILRDIAPGWVKDWMTDRRNTHKGG
jgi:hypothetical protein